MTVAMFRITTLVKSWPASATTVDGGERMAQETGTVGEASLGTRPRSPVWLRAALEEPQSSLGTGAGAESDAGHNEAADQKAG